MKLKRIHTCLLSTAIIGSLVQCGKKDDGGSTVPPVANPLVNTKIRLDNTTVVASTVSYNIRPAVAIRLSFNNAVDRSTVASAVSLTESGASSVSLNYAYENNDSTLVVTPSASLKYLAKFNFAAGTGLRSVKNTALNTSLNFSFVTQIDSTNKFPIISDDALLTLVQQQTFKYFWDFGHPVSGLARERNTSGETVTSGGSGFGIMTIPVAISRSFITRAQGLARMQTIVGFLKNTAQKFHGAFPHWLNGTTGVVIPFSEKDNGADLVETSYLMAGLICAREYFNGADAAETTLRTDINTIYDNVEWDWFRQGNQNVLYWHWSPNYNWEINMPIRGWNECLITYIMAASSTTHPIPQSVYSNGWAQNGSIVNNNTYYGLQLPLGAAFGGPLFFAHYSFLGVNPNGLSDAYASSYFTQNKNHTLINYKYCIANPSGNFGYSNLCWGLTASDIENGYTASSPTNDVGVIAPTAALSSFPYTPTESMDALKFFYYKLGNKIWGNYGFIDAFSLKSPWFANSTLAIDQGPIIVMIENYRTGLLWNLFTGAADIKNGMRNLGFAAPYL